jgi:hypothetical protein
MQNVLISVEDSALDNVMYLLRNLSDVKIINNNVKENITIDEDLSFLTPEIQKGFDSGESKESHQEFMNRLKSKYA